MVRAAMTRFGVGLASILMCAILAAPPDNAAAGNGLYSPFPALARKRAEHFVNSLRAPRAQPPVSRAELETGSFSGGLSPMSAGAATARASDPNDVSAISVFVVVALLTGTCAIAALRRHGE
jgi:hypothetical protein